MKKKIWGQVWISLAALILIWGLSWPIYKSALVDNPPFLFAGLRSLLGGVILTAVLWPKLKMLQWRKNGLKYIFSSIVNVVLFYGLQCLGLIYLPGGLFSVLVYLQPILLSLFAWMWFGERMTVLKIAGLVIGFGGIVVIGADGFTGEISLFGVVIALLTALAWALGTLYVKKESAHVDALWMVAVPNIIGGAVLTGIGGAAEGWSSIHWNPDFFLGLVFGALFGTTLAFVIYYLLVNRGDASKVASFTFLVPLVSVLAGSLFLNEPLTPSLLAGLIMIVLSIVFVNRSVKYAGKQKVSIHHSK